MSNKNKPEDLEKVLKKYLEDYVEDITEDVGEVTDSVTKEAVEELKQKSPKGKGSRANPYHTGWTKQKGKLNKGRYTIKIHNKTNYQLTHLLEFGHATRNGGRTNPISHIRPIEEKYKKEYEEKITTVIRRRSAK